MPATVTAPHIDAVSARVVPEIDLHLLAREGGLLMLLATVPDLTPFQVLESVDCRLWMRWADPAQTGPPEERIEIAMATRADQHQGTATVIARTAPKMCDEARAMYRVVEDQAVADLVFCEEGGSPDRSHWFVCVDLTHEFDRLGLAVGRFPKRYLLSQIRPAPRAAIGFVPFPPA